MATLFFGEAQWPHPGNVTQYIQGMGVHGVSSNAQATSETVDKRKEL